jgi:hypothetical protein
MLFGKIFLCSKPDCSIAVKDRYLILIRWGKVALWHPLAFASTVDSKSAFPALLRIEYAAAYAGPRPVAFH